MKRTMFEGEEYPFSVTFADATHVGVPECKMMLEGCDVSSMHFFGAPSASGKTITTPGVSKLVAEKEYTLVTTTSVDGMKKVLPINIGVLHPWDAKDTTTTCSYCGNELHLDKRGGCSACGGR